MDNSITREFWLGVFDSEGDRILSLPNAFFMLFPQYKPEGWRFENGGYSDLTLNQFQICHFRKLIEEVLGFDLSQRMIY